MAKRMVTVTIILALVVVSGWALYLYFKHFSGIYPALSQPSRDIAELIRQGESPLVYPEEFELSIFADGLTGPRVITFDPAGTMLVSLPSTGRVVALPDIDHNGRADRVIDVAVNLNRPHGLAFSREPRPRLFIAEIDQVAAYAYDPDALTVGPPEHIVDLPGGGGHSTRTLLFLPPPAEKSLLISVGSSCNACEEGDWRRAKILVLDLNDGKLKTFASGLRNAVFITVHPETDDIWVTEMGRDYLGDNLPPDEINIAAMGNDYGWPRCYGKNIADTEYLGAAKAEGACSGTTPSKIDIQAHSAPLGLDFFPSQGWPSKYRNKMLVAYHGSWNRTVPTGYKVVLFSFDGQGNLLGREDFISGWLREKKISIGRPVGIRIRDNGRIFISDDKAGVIYLLTLSPADRPAAM
jgi:glucose/arabinose dehydrogenase